MSNKLLSKIVIFQFFLIIAIFLYFNYKTKALSHNEIVFEDGIDKITLNQGGLLIEEDSIVVFKLRRDKIQFYNGHIFNHFFSTE
jgi:hypothetical protein